MMSYIRRVPRVPAENIWQYTPARELDARDAMLITFVDGSVFYVRYRTPDQVTYRHFGWLEWRPIEAMAELIVRTVPQCKPNMLEILRDASFVKDSGYVGDHLVLWEGDLGDRHERLLISHTPIQSLTPVTLVGNERVDTFNFKVDDTYYPKSY